MTRKAAQESFWNWFSVHEAELFNFDPEQEVKREELFNRLQTELLKVDPGLGFEFSPPGDEKREFVISACGIKSAFPAVISLVDAAPKFERWQVTAFRPRRTPIMPVEYNGKCVDPKDVQFTLLNNGKKAGLYLFMPGYQEDDASLKVIGFLLLDEALGEYDVECRLGMIEMLSPDARTEGKRHPFAELPTLFDRLVSQLEGRSGKPL